jgi:acetyl esterase
MTRSRRRLGLGAGVVLAGVLAAVVLLIVTGCGAVAPGSADGPPPVSGVTVVENVDFGGSDGVRLDVCAPDATSTAPPAIISVHGGGWSQGDKSERPWRQSCEWLAAEGFLVFQTNYRLAPAHPFPAAMDDITAAVSWIRRAQQVDRFGHDPERLGAFGDSAGGNLVALLGTRGDGNSRSGARVAAVVALSAPLDLTREGTTLGDLGEDFQRVQLGYLGCRSYDDCPAARSASPAHQIDPSDPPFFIAHSSDEFIPVEQAETFVSGLKRAGVDAAYVRVDGSAHGLALLGDGLRERIADWLHDTL